MYENRGQVPAVGIDGLTRETMEQQLERQLRMHKEQIEKIERIQELLKKNPEIEELLNLARSLGL